MRVKVPEKLEAKLLRGRLLARVATATMMVLLAAYLTYYFGFRTEERSPTISIGAGVSFQDSSRGQPNLKLVATERTDIASPIQHEAITQLAPVTYISSNVGSQLSRQITLLFQLRFRIFKSDRIIVAVSEDGQEWEAEDASVSADGTSAWIVRSHLSLFQPLLVNVGNFIKKEIKDAVSSLTGGLIDSPDSPSCTSTSRYGTSSSRGPLDWCLDGAFGTSKYQASIRAVNKKRYPLQISLDGLRQINNAGIPLEIKFIADIFSSESQVVMFPFSSAEFAIDTVDDYKRTITTKVTPTAQNLYRLYMAAGALLAFAGILQSKNNNNSSSRTWEVLATAANAEGCVKAIAQVEFGEALASCKDLVPAIAKGLVGKVLGVIAAAGTFLTALLSEINAYLDSEDGQDEQSIMIFRT